jgi:DNA-binding NarL/FixJ family response regulator
METDDAIAAELRESQAAVNTIDTIRRRRQAAVLAALDAGWTKYRIAAELGVAAPTVDSVIKAGRRDEDGTEGAR